MVHDDYGDLVPYLYLDDTDLDKPCTWCSAGPKELCKEDGE